MEMMKKYVLADAEAQKIVDLDEYEGMIVETVFDAIDQYPMVVGSKRNCYYIKMDRYATEEEETAIEAALCGSELGRYCTPDGTRFTGIETTVKEMFPHWKG